MTDQWPKTVKGIAAVAVLALVLMILANILGTYRSGKRSAPTADTTASVPATGSGEPTKSAEGDKEKAPAKQPTPKEEPASQAPTQDVVTVKVDGLNFRVRPTPTADVIRGLNAGEKLTLLEEEGGWYRVRDASGVIGWITSNEQYSTRGTR